jgi:outer membrane protein assembly factor BamB
MASSIFTDGILYVPTKGMAAMKPGASGAHPEVLWQNNQLTPSTASPVVLDGKVFTLNNAGILSAADAKDGKRLWQLRTTGPYSATPIGFGKHLYLANEKGLVQVVDVSAPEGKVVSTLDLKDTLIGTPSIAGGAVYVRSDKALVKLGGS